MRLALYQPDIPQNTGTIARLAACLGLALDIIEPAGFPVSDRAFRRAGMDYLDQVEIRRHESFDAFNTWRRGHRLVLATTKAACAHTQFAFADSDIVLLGRESAGVPEEVHAGADARVLVPMRPGLRSLNVAMAAALIVGEALRQLGAFPGKPQAETDPHPAASRPSSPLQGEDARRSFSLPQQGGGPGWGSKAMACRDDTARQEPSSGNSP